MQSAYRKLVNDISSIITRSGPKAKASGSRLKLTSRWEIGRRIARAGRNRRLKTEYGSELLNALSRDLTNKFGQGLSAASLIYMREFYEAYPAHIPQPLKEGASGKLKWKYVRDLLSVRDKEARDSLLKKAVSGNWPTRKLMRAIRKYRLSQGEAPPEKGEDGYQVLTPARGRLMTYRVIAPKRRRPAPSDVVIDCGFNINVEVGARGIKRIRAGDIVEASKTTGGYRIKRSKSSEDRLYTSGAFIEKVIDGDTLWADIGCGFNIWTYQKLRLRGLNAPRVSTKRGLRAKRFLEDVFRKAPFFVTKTYKTDKYDRYLADIFYLPGETDPKKILTKGTFLNQQLIDLGLAVRI